MATSLLSMEQSGHLSDLSFTLSGFSLSLYSDIDFRVIVNLNKFELICLLLNECQVIELIWIA